MTTFYFLTGFEHQVVAASMALSSSYLRIWREITGSPTIGASYKRSGDYGLQINPSAATEYVSIDFATGTRRLIGSFYFMRKSGNNFRIASGSQSTGGLIFTVNGSNVFQAQISGSTAVGSTTCSVDTWYRIDFDADCSGSTHTVNWKIDGTDQTQASVSATAQDITTWRMGNTSSATFEGWYDDLALSKTAGDYPIGEVIIKGYLPVSDGTHSPSDPSTYFRDAAGSNITSSSNPAWDNLLYIPTRTARVDQYGYSIEEYLFVNMADSSESSAPLAVQGVVGITTAGTNANELAAGFIHGGNTKWVWPLGDVSITTNGIAPIWQCWNKQFDDSTAWTDTAFDSIQFTMGNSNDVNAIPGVTGCILEAAFAGTTAQNVNVSLIDQAGVIYAPTLKFPQDKAVGLIDQSGTIYAPSKLNQTVPALALVDQTGTIYAIASLTKVKNVSIGFIDQTGTPFALDKLEQDVNLGFVNQQGQLFQPIWGQSTGLGIIDQSGVAYSPSLSQKVTIGQIDQTGELWGVTPSQGGTPQNVNVGIIDQSGTVYSFSISQKVALALLDQTGVINAITSTRSMSVPLIDQSGQVFGVTTTSGVTQQVGLVDQTGTLYSVTISVGGIDVVIPLLDYAGTVYVPTTQADEEAPPWDDEPFRESWFLWQVCKNPQHQHYPKTIYRPYPNIPHPER